MQLFKTTAFKFNEEGDKVYRKKTTTLAVLINCNDCLQL